MRRELKKLGLNSCFATRKPLESVSDIKRKKKRDSNLPKKIKIEFLSSEKRSHGPLSLYLPLLR